MWHWLMGVFMLVNFGITTSMDMGRYNSMTVVHMKGSSEMDNYMEWGNWIHQMGRITKENTDSIRNMGKGNWVGRMDRNTQENSEKESKKAMGQWY